MYVPCVLACIPNCHCEAACFLRPFHVLCHDLASGELRGLDSLGVLVVVAAKALLRIVLRPLCVETIQQQKQGFPKHKRRLFECIGDISYVETHVYHSLAGRDFVHRVFCELFLGLTAITRTTFLAWRPSALAFGLTLLLSFVGLRFLSTK